MADKKEMTAVEFLKHYKRMCRSTGQYCVGCPLSMEGSICRNWIQNNPEEAVAIVQKWAEENPVKTFMSDFFEKFPNAPKNELGFPDEACPYMLGYDDCCSFTPAKEEYCLRCWSRPLEG